MSDGGSDQVRAAWISGLLGIVAVLIGAAIGLRPALLDRMLPGGEATSTPAVAPAPLGSPGSTPASLPGSVPGVATRPATPIDQDYPVPASATSIPDPYPSATTSPTPDQSGRD